MSMKRREINFSRKLALLSVFFFQFSFISVSLAQNSSINGKVVDINKQPLPGVTIAVRGEKQISTTNIEGEYSIKVDKSKVLEFSFIGMVKQRITVSDKKILNIILLEDTKNLNEVVIVGYGVQKKSVVTGSIGRVTEENLEKLSPTRIDNVLKGQTSGVVITQASGQPGDGSRVRIRGVGTINDSEPLYIVDGMPIDGGIDFLNPTDIKSVEVLKDAASGAVYGARAANGVILVTTKAGTKGKLSVKYNFSYGVQNAWKKRSVLNASEYQMLINEEYINSGKSPIYSNPSGAGIGTDWQDETFYKNAPVVNHQVSINGGNDKGTYFLSFGQFSQDGIVGGNFNRSNYKRWNVRLNNTYNLFDATKERNFLSSASIGTNIAYARTLSKGIATNTEYGSPLGSALLLSPLLPVYASDPAATLAAYPFAIANSQGRIYSVAGDVFNEITNPLAQLQLPGAVGNSDKFVTSFWGELQLIDNLKFKSAFSSDLSFWGDDGWIPPYYLGSTNARTNSVVWSSMNRGFTWQVENTLSYQKKLFDKHNISILLGQSAKKNSGVHLWGQNYNLQSLDPEKANLGFALGVKADQETVGWTYYSTLASYFGRLSYNYDEKYMFEATVRRDGSSNFGPNNHWATFPALSAGWVITQESFMSSRPEWFDLFKIRASWGKNGNERIGQFKYTTTMQSNNNYTLGSGDSEAINVGIKPAGMPNADLRWEESEQSDIGLEAKLFNSALNLTVDLFKKRTNGMLMQMPLPQYIGDTPPVGNVGIMDNSGIEFDMSYRFKVSDLNVSLSANASYIKNVLVDLGNSNGWANYDNIQNIGTITRAQNGEEFPYFYGLKTAGIFQTAQEVATYTKDGVLIQPKAVPGDVRFVDINGDGSINDADKTKIGKGMPDWTYGFTISFDWKGFDLSAFFNGTVGNDVFDATRRLDLLSVNLPSYMLNRWTGPNTSNTIPRMALTDDNSNWLSSDLYVCDGSYLRLRNLQVGYTLPSHFTKLFFVNNLRFYFSAENLMTFTSYRGFDPEISSGGTSLGVDRGVYPQAKTISVGASISF